MKKDEKECRDEIKYSKSMLLTSIAVFAVLLVLTALCIVFNVRDIIITILMLASFISLTAVISFAKLWSDLAAAEDEKKKQAEGKIKKEPSEKKIRQTRIICYGVIAVTAIAIVLTIVLGANNYAKFLIDGPLIIASTFCVRYIRTGKFTENQ